MALVWKIAPGVGAEDWDLFRKHGCIGLGWLEDSDYRDYASEKDVLAALEQRHGKRAPGAGSESAKMIWQFVNDVKTHHVVVANEGYNNVVGIGIITSAYIPPTSTHNPLRKDSSTHRHHVRRVDWLITDALVIPGKRFFVQSTLRPLGNDKLGTLRDAYRAKYPHLKQTLEQLLVGYQAGVGGPLPEEVAETPKLPEGAVRKITVNAYERNPKARKKCIAAHGTTCCICGFMFGAFYGPDAEGYIHVHHLRPLSESDGEYQVDPIEDLRPVCANCHAVLHLGGECRSIEDVRKMLKKK